MPVSLDLKGLDSLDVRDDPGEALEALVLSAMCLETLVVELATLAPDAFEQLTEGPIFEAALLSCSVVKSWRRALGIEEAETRD